MKQCLLACVASALLAVSVAAQPTQAVWGGSNPGPVTRVTIAGRQIEGADVLLHKGTAYVSVPALTQALRASVAAQGQVAFISIPAASDAECESMPNAKRLSDAYRKAAVRIPDEIEALRALASKPGAIIPADSFDAVEHQIAQARFHSATEADQSVSYALEHAHAVLAIIYYKLYRGVPPEQAKQGQLDSVLCSMESKFALQVGRLSGKESCSVFHFGQEEAGRVSSQ